LNGPLCGGEGNRRTEKESEGKKKSEGRAGQESGTVPETAYFR